MLAWLSRAHPVCLPVHSWSVNLLRDGDLAGALLGEQPAPTKPMGSVSLDAVTWALMQPLGAACASALVLLGGLFWAQGKGRSKPVPRPAGLTWAGGCLLSP